MRKFNARLSCSPPVPAVQQSHVGDKIVINGAGHGNNRLAALFFAAALLVPGAASAKFINLSCADQKSALLVRVDTDAKVIQFTGSATPQNWHFLTNVSITDTAFTATVPLAGGGTKQFAIDRASGVLQITSPGGSPAQGNCTVLTLQNQF